MRTSLRRLTAAAAATGADAAFFASPSSAVSSSSALAATQTITMRAMDRVLWGGAVVSHINQLSTAEQLQILAEPYKGRSQPLPLAVYANTAIRLISEGDSVRAMDVVLSRPIAVERSALIELVAAEVPLEDAHVAWEFIRSLAFLETGPVLRATLLIAQKLGDETAIEEALKHVSTTCRRRKNLSGEVLRPFCQMLPPERWAEGQELLDAAQQSVGTYYDARHTDALLWLMLRARQQKRVLAAWAWLKNTTAGRCSSIVSAVIVALTREPQRLADILKLMQHLARNDDDPLPAAQVATLNLMAAMRRPNADYAKDLVSYWQPVDGVTSMRLNLAVATAYAKVASGGGGGGGGGSSPSSSSSAVTPISSADALAAASKAICRIADDPAQAREISPIAIAPLAPLLLGGGGRDAASRGGSAAASSATAEALLRLSETIAEGCVERVALGGMGVVFAIATLTRSDALFSTAVAMFREVIGSDIFDYEAATAPSVSASSDEDVFGAPSSSASTAHTSAPPTGSNSNSSSGSRSSGLFGGNQTSDDDAFFAPSSSSSSPSSASSDAAALDAFTSGSDAQKAYAFVCRELFASLKADRFIEGKATAAALAEALCSAGTEVVVPKDATEWFAFVSSGDESDDASVILDSLGLE